MATMNEIKAEPRNALEQKFCSAVKFHHKNLKYRVLLQLDAALPEGIQKEALKRLIKTEFGSTLGMYRSLFNDDSEETNSED